MPTKNKKTSKWWKLVTRPKAEKKIATSSGRGKTIDRFICLERLKPFFQLQLDITRACDAYNTKARDEFLQAQAYGRARGDKPDYIARSTVQTWYEKDEAVRLLIDAWKDTTNILARQAWRKEIQNWNYWASKDWLERREKDFFSVKVETEHINPPQIPAWTSIRIEKANILFQLWTSQNVGSSPIISSTSSDTSKPSQAPKE